MKAAYTRVGDGLRVLFSWASKNYHSAVFSLTVKLVFSCDLSRNFTAKWGLLESYISAFVCTWTGYSKITLQGWHRLWSTLDCMWIYHVVEPGGCFLLFLSPFASVASLHFAPCLGFSFRSLFLDFFLTFPHYLEISAFNYNEPGKIWILEQLGIQTMRKNCIANSS